MDYTLSNDQSLLAYSVAIQQQQLRDTFENKTLHGEYGGVFKITPEFLVFLQFLISHNRIENIPIIDVNGNPVLVQNIVKFKDTVTDKYFTALYEFYNQYNEVKKCRTLEKLSKFNE